MKSIFKIEMKRAFCNRLFFISLCIGCFLTIADAVMNCVPTMMNLNQYGLPEGAYCFSIFESFEYFVTSHSIWFSIFFMIFPILAAMPFADSYYVDCKSGYVKIYIQDRRKSII